MINNEKHRCKIIVIYFIISINLYKFAYENNEE